MGGILSEYLLPYTCIFKELTGQRHKSFQRKPIRPRNMRFGNPRHLLNGPMVQKWLVHRDGHNCFPSDSLVARYLQIAGSKIHRKRLLLYTKKRAVAVTSAFNKKIVCVPNAMSMAVGLVYPMIINGSIHPNSWLPMSRIPFIGKMRIGRKSRKTKNMSVNVRSEFKELQAHTKAKQVDRNMANVKRIRMVTESREKQPRKCVRISFKKLLNPLENLLESDIRFKRELEYVRSPMQSNKIKQIANRDIMMVHKVSEKQLILDLKRNSVLKSADDTMTSMVLSEKKELTLLEYSIFSILLNRNSMAASPRPNGKRLFNIACHPNIPMVLAVNLFSRASIYFNRIALKIICAQ